LPAWSEWVKGAVMACFRCGSERTRRDGQTGLGGQRWRCHACRRFTARSGSAFSRHAFPDDVIALAVRWSVRYRLSYADLAEWLAERGVAVDRTTLYRWVRRFLPLFAATARAHRQPVGGTWRVDETYCRLKGKQIYCYRASDEDGHVVDAYCSERRNASAARAFFERAIGETDVTPTRVNTDKATCYPPALRVVLPAAEHRRSRYLNTGLERDHGHLKQRLAPTRGCTNLGSADAFCRGHALIRNLCQGFSALTAAVPRALRLATAWPILARAV
jgi:transposase-like protein